MDGVMLEGVVLSAGVAAATGAVGALGVFAVARRRVPVAAVLAPLVVVVSVAAGVYTSVRAMFLSDKDSTTVLLLLASAIPVALGVGMILAVRIWRIAAEAASLAATRERDREIEAGRREMVAWVSHDLRTPLAAVRVLAEALEDGVGDHAETVRRIQAENHRMSEMVDDLLALSRLQSPALVLHRQPVDLRDLVSDAVAAVRPLADAGAVRMVEAEGDGAVAAVDAREVARALANLLVNAVRHTPRGGTVTVMARPAAGRSQPPDLPTAVVTVQDECGGIPEANLLRMFDAGWRGTRARTPERETAGSLASGRTRPPETGGAGLGLAIVREVAEVHGGSASIRNAGKGCVAELRLPIVNGLASGATSSRAATAR
ncbi:sensor histidine kinase [Myceligenerans indicum]|uniref:histidine kinase n=1 Tax=Myceligenerans indicum TaxID=2593663 RepID=A0ABS1LIT6_9MICO|nr:HAMP domain-containing sensor histidine kinase [Myceligenerans indicum]MBL0886117.1 HAMP domain-containing histidine kinase [Myceligenerans indicum]